MQEIREQTLPAETLESAKESSGLSLIIALRQLFNNNVNDECLFLPRQATPTDPTLHSALQLCMDSSHRTAVHLYLAVLLFF